MTKHTLYRILLGIITLAGIYFLYHIEKGVSQVDVGVSVSSNILSGNAHTGTLGRECIKNPEIEFFMYHYIRSRDSKDSKGTADLSVDPNNFESQMSYLRKEADDHSITLMRGSDFLESLEMNCFPGNRIWILTSDDGWTDMYNELYPIAKKYDIPFFLGIIVNRIDAPGFVTKTQIQEMSNNPLFTISSHSMTHRDQDTMTVQKEKIEMCESKKQLESLFHKPVLTYIYPSGRMSKDSQTFAKECGYDLAWSTGHGNEWNKENPLKYDINRIRIHNTTTLDLFKHLINAK